MVFIVVSFIVAYLIGSIPTSIWIGRYFYGIDIREHGSGNAGATNTFRILGILPGSVVTIIDVSKGIFSALIAVVLVKFNLIDDYHLVLYKLLLGSGAVIGHIFPLYENFKGGKGVSVLLGVVLTIHLSATLICVAVFLIVMFTSKYVSLGSMLAALTFPVLFFIPYFKSGDPTLIIFGFIVFILVILTHQKNIVRLLKGEERKINIRLRKKK